MIAKPTRATIYYRSRSMGDPPIDIKTTEQCSMLLVGDCLYTRAFTTYCVVCRLEGARMF